MSVQFGKWKLDGSPVEGDYLERVSALMAPYAPDGAACYTGTGIGILYRSLHTNRESRSETQPHHLPSGGVLTWDGRLDNRQELLHALGGVTFDMADVSIVAAAYERWGNACFPKLLGDWALAICRPADRSLLLAKDFLGPRPLYYSSQKNQIVWSTLLDPLVLLEPHSLSLSEEYLAGWLSSFPASHLTPYIGILAVPPGSYVVFREEVPTVTKYWNFEATKPLRYQNDEQYEEQFRAVLGESIRRRLRSHVPVLAELSGGMDSSSIVCVADTLIAQGRADTPRLDTLSYYDDSEPNWNERPYFTKVEQHRGRTGCHIDVASHAGLALNFGEGRFVPTPGSTAHLQAWSGKLTKYLTSQGHRIVLSGTGGDEVLGGVPNPVPEFADLFARGHLPQLVRKMFAWALAQRKPLPHYAAETLRAFLPVGLVGIEKHRRPPAWLDPAFVERHRSTLQDHHNRLGLFGPRPSFQENLRTLDVLRRQIACCTVSSDPPYEKCYPYLDRDLLEFLYALPRDQLLRPGQRRSLMRRALVGIVPHELLARKRKAFVARGPLAAMSDELSNLLESGEHMVAASLGIVNAQAFAEALQKASTGTDISVSHLTRTLIVERWLRHWKDGRFWSPSTQKSPGPQVQPRKAVELSSEVPTCGTT